ncbi:MAG: type II toxin-antitoxin system VapC family toxin [Chloroflexota bacterium]
MSYPLASASTSPTSPLSSTTSAFPSASGSTVVIDTSAWVSRLLPHDSNYITARTWIDNHILNGGFFVAPMIFVIEVASAIARETLPPDDPQADAHKAVNQLYSLSIMRLVPLDQALVDEATNLAADRRIRGADALFVAVARHLGIPLVTFDKYQLKQPQAVVLTIRP